MASLATLPTDILEQVAIIASSQSLVDLLHLMLTCRSVHDQLSIAYNPHVYASISRQIFDVPFLHQGVPPDSAIAAELIQRLRLFRRIRRGDLSVQALPEALWTAYGLVLEGGSLNASHLAAAGFPAFIEEVLRTYSARTDDRNQREARMACRNLATWLLALTITRGEPSIGSGRGDLAIHVLIFYRRYRTNERRSTRGVAGHPATSRRGQGTIPAPP